MDLLSTLQRRFVPGRTSILPVTRRSTAAHRHIICTTQLFLKGRVESGDWFKFVRESHAAATKGPNGERAFDFINPDDVLLLNYEVMCRTPGTALVSSIAEFLNIDVSAETVSAIAEASTFNSMAKSEIQHGCRLPGWPKRKLPGIERVVRCTQVLSNGTPCNNRDVSCAGATDEGSIETFSARHCRKGGVGGW